MLFSVVVPVFNAVGTLEECLDSVLMQRNEGTEIILIDDGSSDGSEEICDLYANEFANIVVAHQANSGVSSARNRGLSLVTGEWVLFLDSDDYFEQNALEELESAVGDTVDAIFFGYRKIDVDGNTLEVHPGINGSGDSEEAARQILLPEGVFHGFIGNKCIRASLLKERRIAFIDKFKYCEDEEWLLRVIERCRRSLFLNSVLYAYRVSSSSASAFRVVDDALLSGLEARESIVKQVSSVWPALTGLAFARQHMFLDELSRRSICLGDEHGLSFLKEYDTGRIMRVVLNCPDDVSVRIKAKAVFWDLMVAIPVPLSLKKALANLIVRLI